MAYHLKISECMVYCMATVGKVPALKVSGSWPFQQLEIEKSIREKHNQAAKECYNQLIYKE